MKAQEIALEYGRGCIATADAITTLSSIVWFPDLRVSRTVVASLTSEAMAHAVPERAAARPLPANINVAEAL